MIDFSEICCTFAPCMCLDTCTNILKRKTLESIGHLKPPKNQAPKTDNQCSCVGTDYCCCRGKALGGA